MFISPAYAQAAQAPAAEGPGLFVALAPWLLVFLIFWLLVLRPQQRRAKAHAAKIQAVKRGDQVVTGGGLMGRVTKVDGDTVEVELAQGVRVKAVKGSLSDVVEPSGGKPAND